MLRRHITSSAVIYALPLALIACGEKAPSDPRTQAPLVRTAVAQATRPMSRSFTGTVAARIQSDVGFRVPGKVLERLVDVGQSVKRGDPLMRIDSADLTLAVQAQQEAVTAARARAQQTTEDEARYRDLRGSGAISASTYDQIKAAADTANAQLHAAEAQANLARNASRYAELIADSDGIVMETLAEPGQVISAGQTVVRLAHVGPREAVIQLPETLRPAIGSTGQATLFGKEDIHVSAKLRQLSDTADRFTRTFEARYVLDAELANAPLGATVVIQVQDNALFAQDSALVPISSLFDAGKGPGVWLIHGEPAQVSWRPVSILHVNDDGALISGQVKQGDQIVALGPHLLHEGDLVRTSVKSAATLAEGAHP